MTCCFSCLSKHPEDTPCLIVISCHAGISPAKRRCGIGHRTRNASSPCKPRKAGAAGTSTNPAVSSRASTVAFRLCAEDPAARRGTRPGGPWQVVPPCHQEPVALARGKCLCSRPPCLNSQKITFVHGRALRERAVACSSTPWRRVAPKFPMNRSTTPSSQTCDQRFLHPSFARTAEWLPEETSDDDLLNQTEKKGRDLDLQLGLPLDFIWKHPLQSRQAATGYKPKPYTLLYISNEPINPTN